MGMKDGSRRKSDLLLYKVMQKFFEKCRDLNIRIWEIGKKFKSRATSELDY